MATTQNTFTGDGSNLGPFSFTFKWLESTDIKVTVAGVLKTAGTHYNLQSLNYSTKTGGQVLFTAGNAPANGAAIVVYRETDDTDLAATFYSGSAIRAQDLNNNFIQGLYVTQESSNNAAAATTAANAATTTANTALSNSTAAQASAATAISTANSAVSTANSAVSTANSAVSTANAASAAASSAVSTANTANATASSALSAVSEALAYTTVANVAAIPGSPTNGDALRITNSTGIESFTPLIGVPVGFVGNSALTVEIYYNGTSATWIWSRYFPNDPENRYWTGSVVVSDTTPLSPTDDSLWYDSIGGRFYIWYNDGNTSQWVDVSPQGNRTSTFLAGTAALPGLTPEGDSNTGIYSPGADQVAISTNGSERLRVDSSGRVGIGSNATSPSQQLHVRTDQAGYTWTRIDNQSSSASAYAGLMLGAFGNSWGIVNGSSAANGNSMAFVIDAGGTNSEKLRIDTSGRLLVGTSTARSMGGISAGIFIEGTAYNSISINNNTNDAFSSLLAFGKSRGTANGAVTSVGNGDRLGGINFYGADGSTNVEAARITAEVDGTPGANDMPGRLVFSTTADGASSPTERVRITQSGDVFIGTTTSGLSNSNGFGFNNASGQSYLNVGHPSGTNSGFEYIGFSYAGSQIGSIRQSGTTGVSFNTSSDYRLKENVVPLEDATLRVKQLKPSQFNFIAEPSRTVDGFIAHEVQAVVPECVTGEKDAVDDEGDPIYQGIDQSKLVPLLTAALQEAIGRIETLEAQNAQLDARLTALEGGTN